MTEVERSMTEMHERALATCFVTKKKKITHIPVRRNKILYLAFIKVVAIIEHAREVVFGLLKATKRTAMAFDVVYEQTDSVMYTYFLLNAFMSYCTLNWKHINLFFPPSVKLTNKYVFLFLFTIFFTSFYSERP